MCSQRSLGEKLRALAIQLAEDLDDDLVLGFPFGPQVLALRPDDPQAFRAWAATTTGRVPVSLRYAPGRPHGEWAVRPTVEPSGRRIVLRFGTPPALAEWIFAPGRESPERLDEVKSGLLSSITIYQDGRPIELRLDVDLGSVGEPVPRDGMLTKLQEERLDRDLAWEPEEEEPDDHAQRWTAAAVTRFVDLLGQRDPSRLAVLLFAVAHGDWISRAHIYELMEYEPRRKLSGFTKPFEGVRTRLVAEDLLGVDTPKPIAARYHGADGWALGLDVDREFGKVLRRNLPELLFDPDDE